MGRDREIGGIGEYTNVVKPVLHVGRPVTVSPVVHFEGDHARGRRRIIAPFIAPDAGARRKKTAIIGEDRLTVDRDGEVAPVVVGARSAVVVFEAYVHRIVDPCDHMDVLPQAAVTPAAQEVVPGELPVAPAIGTVAIHISEHHALLKIGDIAVLGPMARILKFKIIVQHDDLGPYRWAGTQGKQCGECQYTKQPFIHCHLS